MGVLFKKPLFWVVFILLLSGLLIFLLKPSAPKKTASENVRQKTPKTLMSSAKPGSCLVLEQKYCAGGKIVDWKHEGQTYKLVGFRLPPNTPVFSPTEGSLGKAKQQGGSFTGYQATVLNSETTTTYSLVGDLYFENMLSKSVRKGDIIGFTQETGIKNLGDYNLLFSIIRLDKTSQKFLTPENVLNALFPNSRK